MQLSLTLAVADLEQTADFYREILALALQRRQTAEGFPPFLLLRCAGTCIVFRQAAVLEARHPALLQNLSRQPLGVGVQLELDCDDLSAVRRNADRYGWPVCYELEDAQHRRRELWLRDPDGYLLVLNEER